MWRHLMTSLLLIYPRDAIEAGAVVDECNVYDAIVAQDVLSRLYLCEK